MAGSDVTTKMPTAMDGEAVDDDPRAPLSAAATPSNGKRTTADTPEQDDLVVLISGAAGPPVEPPDAVPSDLDTPPVELPDGAPPDLAEPSIDEPTSRAVEPYEDEDEDWAIEPIAPAPRGRRAQRRAAREHERLLRISPAARRAELAAAAAWIAAGNAAFVAAPAPPTGRGRLVRRLFALLALLMLPASILAIVATNGPVTPMSRADASFISMQLVLADQRVRAQLSRLGADGTAGALARTRDASLTVRSLAIEVRTYAGAEVGRLRRALRLEGAWLDAAGSTLVNPRSPLRAELVARDAAARAALTTLPARHGRRQGGAHGLVAYARSRERAGRAATPRR
jgi:hypothetical protein